MLAVMAAKTAERVRMAGVVRKILPAYLDCRIIVPAIDVLYLPNGPLYLALFRGGDIRVGVAIEICNHLPDPVGSFVLTIVVLIETLYGYTLDLRERWV